jgi:hypothetical protein
MRYFYSGERLSQKMKLNEEAINKTNELMNVELPKINRILTISQEGMRGKTLVLVDELSEAKKLGGLMAIANKTEEKRV